MLNVGLLRLDFIESTGLILLILGFKMGRSYSSYEMVVPIFVFMVWMLAGAAEAPTEVTRPKCHDGWVFDTGPLECRQCGLCCQKHEPQDGCMSQGLPRNHSCISDDACTDSADIGPAEHVNKDTDWPWTWILGSVGIGLVCLVVVVAGIIGLTSYLRNRRGSYQRLDENAAAAAQAAALAPEAAAAAAGGGETATADHVVQISSDPTQEKKVEAQYDPPRPPPAGQTGSGDPPLSVLSNPSVATSTEFGGVGPGRVDDRTAHPPNSSNLSAGQTRSGPLSVLSEASVAPSTEYGGVGPGVVNPNTGGTAPHPPNSSNMPVTNSENTQSPRKSPVQNDERPQPVPSLMDTDQTEPKTTE